MASSDSEVAAASIASGRSLDRPRADGRL